jgi:hypothetical protein
MSRHKKLRPKLSHNPASPLPPVLSNHKRKAQGPQAQLDEVRQRVNVLAFRGGLSNTDRDVLNLIAFRLKSGLVLSEGDYACMAALWAKHGGDC